MRTLIAVVLILFLAAPLFAQSMGEDSTSAKPGKPKVEKKPTETNEKQDLGIVGGRYPHVSPDGKTVAFAVDGDLWIVPIEGGRATRLTLNEANDVKPVWSPDGKHIAFTSDRSGSFDVWMMPAEGGVPTRLTFDGATDHVCEFAPDGKTVIFQSARTGAWRIYSVPVTGGTPTPLTEFRSTTASVGPDGYLYFQDSRADSLQMGYRGSANDDLYRSKPGELPEQLTKNKQNDREPHISPDGKRLYFTRETGKKGKDVNLHVLDLETKKVTQLTNLLENGISYLSLNQEGTRAFFAWNFRMYYLDLGVKDAKPQVIPVRIIEDTRRDPVEERTATTGADGVDVSADGNGMAFSLGGGIWVMGSGGGNARQLTPSGSGDANPRISPDGKRISFYSTGRTKSADLFVINLDGTGLRQLTFHEGGDFFQAWTPDSNALVFCSERSGNKDIWRVGLDGTPPVQITKNRFNEDDPTVSPDGRYIAFDAWANNRADIYIMNVDGSGMRQVYGTIAQEESPHFSPDGRLLVFTRSATSGTSRSQQVVVTDLNGSGEVVVAEGSAGVFTPDGLEIVYIDGRGHIKAAPAPKDIRGGRTIPFIAKREVEQSKLFAQAFDEAWNRIAQNFYDAKFHGVDWNAMKTRYRPLAVGAKTRMEFYYYMRLMIGELNASHQGISGPISDLRGFATGSLACELVPEAMDPMPGRGGKPGPVMQRIKVVNPDRGGPADQAWIRDGDYIFGVNKKRLRLEDNFFLMMKDTVGKDVQLLVGTDPDGSNMRVVTVKPESSSAARDRAYGQWIAKCKKTTAEESKGQIAYIHIPQMNVMALRRFEAELASPGVQRAKALVLDVRNNGGGNIHQALIDILSRRHYANNSSRRGPRQKAPNLFWARPIVLLINEHSYSDAEVFPHAFKTLGLGKIVGMPTPGAVIGTQDVSLVDGSRLRITLQGFHNLDGKNQEGRGCVPDVIVEMTPEDIIKGNDPQLQKAIEILKAEIAPKPKVEPKKEEPKKAEPKAAPIAPKKEPEAPEAKPATPKVDPKATPEEKPAMPKVDPKPAPEKKPEEAPKTPEKPKTPEEAPKAPKTPETPEQPVEPGTPKEAPAK